MLGFTMIGDLFTFGFGAAGLLVGILGAIGLYKTFGKANRSGILAFIPILNLLNFIDMAERPVWWIFLMLIPGVNVIVTLIVLNGIARRFGKGWLFGVGLLLVAPLCWFILGFGNAQYRSAG